MFTRLSIALACILIGLTAYRMATRTIQFTSIDIEVSQGYATDRWGYGPPETHDDGVVWGTEQKNEYDQRTRFFQVTSIAAVTILAVLLVGDRRRRSHRTDE